MELSRLLTFALEEDCPSGDVTTDLMVAADTEGEARLISKDEGIFFGQEIIRTVFDVLGVDAMFHFSVEDGQTVTPSRTICTILAPVKAILKAERVMLNLVQRLSGVATITAEFVKRLDNPAIKVLDTRKTTPLWRGPERQAVVAGGGYNHRYSLSDMVLIKENHLAAFAATQGLGQLGETLHAFKRNHPGMAVEVEVDSVQQLERLDLSAADVIMLDNFPIDLIKKAVSVCRNREFKAEIEISGTISLDNIHLYRHLDIQRISIGRLTHSVRALDLSLLL